MTPDDILTFWFPLDKDRSQQLWWGKSPELDLEIHERFGTTLAAAKAHHLDTWAETAQGRVALIIILDQFSRNCFRDEPETYAADAKACQLTMEGLERGHDQELKPIERLFFYLPLEHSENLKHQELSVDLIKQLQRNVSLQTDVPKETQKQFESFVKFAIQHHNVIDKFGRFPHRNKLLGRVSTPEEEEYLAQPGAGF